MANPLNGAGTACLYLPNRFQAQNPLLGLPPQLPQLGAVSFPIPPLPAMGSSFPFLQLTPPLRPQTNYGIIQCARLRKAQLSTQPSHTATANAVNDMAQRQPPATQLRILNRCNALWGNLQNYVAMDIPLPINPIAPGLWQPPLRTNNLPAPQIPMPPLPTAGHQVEAIYGLWNWHCGMKCVYPEVIVESEPAVQDQVYSQLVKPLDLLLRTRYSAHASGVQYPHWGRPTSAVHTVPARDMSGFPDFVLYKGPGFNENAAVWEVKPWWSYSDLALDRAFAAPVVLNVPHNNTFMWNVGDTISHQLIKQIWGEIVYFNADFGIWTNGRRVTLFCRTGPDTLTFASGNHRWDDSDVLFALFGLTCASVDIRECQTPQAKLHFINTLSPPAGRF